MGAAGVVDHPHHAAESLGYAHTGCKRQIYLPGSKFKRYVVGAVVRGFLVLVAQVLATTPSLEEAMVGGFDRWL